MSLGMPGSPHSAGLISTHAHPLVGPGGNNLSECGLPVLLQFGLSPIIPRCGGGPVHEEHMSVFITLLVPFSRDKRCMGQLPNDHIWSRKALFQEF